MSDDSLSVLWGCRSIANFINASEKKTYYLLEGGLIDATKVGDVWTSSKARLRAQFDMPRIERPPDSAVLDLDAGGEVDERVGADAFNDHGLGPWRR